ncbi:unnamed protein product [Acanthoscelides obtectus]|uniref:protein-tyrosine-phosphatase n=1 Tax=Acanthoscelides obtectus TaxID=200917 RepID=A0A9P0K0W7_ACAOB|nr:unnamed protein product [Acanthoscelides obtectus]CAK1629109.1 M-phase inducer phosphatase [Acanthoscelides obtectus]
MCDSLCSETCNTCKYSRRKARKCCDGDDPFLEKENLRTLSPMKSDDLSMYDSAVTSTGPHCFHGRLPRALQEHDSNSRDSGYGMSYGEKFMSYASPNRTSAASFGSLSSMEDEFIDFTDVEPLDKQKLPHDFNKLITNPIINTRDEGKSSPKDTVIRPLFRRAMSLQTDMELTPNSTRARTSLFKDEEMRSFKRPEPPSCIENITGIKRSRIFDGNEQENAVPLIKVPIQRALSTEETIMCAVQKSSTEPDLIGDFSKNFCLPLVRGKHQDLKSISSHTLARLMNGEFNDMIASFKVIDCRYPYEFEGGHINGAVNIYTKEQCMQLLQETQLPAASTMHQRHILVFHCEFSSERGPNLYRYLRREDRQKNESAYPALHYPEIYLLEGGYKSFFEQYSTMCIPTAYKAMLHPDHEEDLKHFRQKSRTWNCDTRQRPQSQPNKFFKRLGI